VLWLQGRSGWLGQALFLQRSVFPSTWYLSPLAARHGRCAIARVQTGAAAYQFPFLSQK
jgi:hypothetical protein